MLPDEKRLFIPGLSTLPSCEKIYGNPGRFDHVVVR